MSSDRLTNAPHRYRSTVIDRVGAVTDLLPPRIRYGYVHPATRRWLGGTLPVLGSIPNQLSQPRPSPTPRADCDGLSEVVLMAGDIEIGGIGSVIRYLMGRLPRHGFRPTLVTSTRGERVKELSAAGCSVHVVRNSDHAVELLQDLRPDAVELHAPGPVLEAAALCTGLPLVPVLHNTEIHYTKRRWRQFEDLLANSAVAIAVSQTVADFHRRHVRDDLGGRIRIVPNVDRTDWQPMARPDQRQSARQHLGSVIGEIRPDTVVVACIARYDVQKNVPGLVASFLSGVRSDRIHLVVAGEPSDWIEVRRAQALSAGSGRSSVSLLGRSHAPTLLAAADLFVLNSFFEGWPMAASEAAAGGLPLVLADFGGARELIEMSPGSVLVTNPCGSVAGVSDRTVRNARGRYRRQHNSAELASAIERVAARKPVAEVPIRAGESMAEGHANVLRGVARAGGSKQGLGRNNR